MIQINDIPALLEQLKKHIADDLEGQELDFKHWEDNFIEMMRILVRTVVSFANAGEGLIIAGVKERVLSPGIMNIRALAKLKPLIRWIDLRFLSYGR